MHALRCRLRCRGALHQMQVDERHPVQRPGLRFMRTREARSVQALPARAAEEAAGALLSEEVVVVGGTAIVLLVGPRRSLTGIECEQETLYYFS